MPSEITRDYAVGYGKPPVHTRFQKGKSGNPKGRPRGVTAARVKGLILQEGYRKIPLRAEFLASKGYKPVPIAQDTTANSDLGNLQDRPKSMVRRSAED